MKTPTHIRLVEAIAGVEPADVADVKTRFPAAFAARLPELRQAPGRKVRELIENLRALFQLLTDPHEKLPWRTTAAAVFALGYFLLPLDVIPDVVPVLGFLDDALVVAEVVFFLSDDLRRYRARQPAGDPPISMRTEIAPRGEDRLVA